MLAYSPRLVLAPGPLATLLDTALAGVLVQHRWAFECNRMVHHVEEACVNKACLSTGTALAGVLVQHR